MHSSTHGLVLMDLTRIEKFGVPPKTAHRCCCAKCGSPATPGGLDYTSGVIAIIAWGSRAGSSPREAGSHSREQGRQADEGGQLSGVHGRKAACVCGVSVRTPACLHACIHAYEIYSCASLRRICGSCCVGATPIYELTAMNRSANGRWQNGAGRKAARGAPACEWPFHRKIAFRRRGGAPPPCACCRPEGSIPSEWRSPRWHRQ